MQTHIYLTRQDPIVTVPSTLTKTKSILLEKMQHRNEKTNAEGKGIENHRNTNTCIPVSLHTQFAYYKPVSNSTLCIYCYLVKYIFGWQSWKFCYLNWYMNDPQKFLLHEYTEDCLYQSPLSISFKPWESRNYET